MALLQFTDGSMNEVSIFTSQLCGMSYSTNSPEIRMIFQSGVILYYQLRRFDDAKLLMEAFKKNENIDLNGIK